MLTRLSLLRILTLDKSLRAFYRFLPDGFKLRALPGIPELEISPCRKKNSLDLERNFPAVSSRLRPEK